jgi:hypothetical protein
LWKESFEGRKAICQARWSRSVPLEKRMLTAYHKFSVLIVL